MAFLSFVPEKRCSLAEKDINKMCDLEIINLIIQNQQEGILKNLPIRSLRILLPGHCGGGVPLS